MATNCDSCGHRSNEVKSGGGIEPKGIRFEVKVRSREDFSRDVMKVRAFLLIPDLLQTCTLCTLIFDIPAYKMTSFYSFKSQGK
jgi:C4-type Zn-finger protein